MVKDKDSYSSLYSHIVEVVEYTNTLKLDKSINTIQSYLTSIDRFFDYIEVSLFKDISNIDTSVCRKYQIKLKEEGLQPSSNNAHIRALKVFFNWLKTNEYIEDNPFDKIKFMKQPKKELSFLSNEEVHLMIEACKNIRDKTILAFLLSLGLRRSELVNLKLSDIDGYEVNIIGKGSKYRRLYLPEDVYNLLQDYLKTRKYTGEYLFYSNLLRRFTPNSIRAKIKSIAKRAGIDDERVNVITPHSARRTFATNLVEQDVNMRIIQGAMGHQSISTTMRYAKLRDSAVERAMRKQKPIITGSLTA